MRAVYRDGIPDLVNTYNTPVSSVTQDREQGLYIQDRWRPTRKLTLNLGLRFETNYGWMPETCQPQTNFIAGRCFAEVNGAPDWKALNPRFSAVYDLFGDGGTALKFAANRYVVPVGVQVVGRVNPVASVSDNRQWLPLQRAGDAWVRWQRRPDTPAQRAWSVVGILAWHEQPLCRRLRLAACQGVHRRASAPVTGQRRDFGRLHPT
jgi:hypothetical protein